MKQYFSELEKILRDIVIERETKQQFIVELNKSRKDFAEDYIKANIEPRITKIQNEVVASEQASYEKIQTLLVELEKAAVEKSSRLNLANPAWANALKLIELTGADMDSDTIRRINASFLGDQAALRALRDVYKSAGFAYDGGIDQQIYNPETRFEHLRNANHSTFVRGGALNSLANEISQVAAMEGIDFPQVIDEDGMRQAMWKGAGLPVV